MMGINLTAIKNQYFKFTVSIIILFMILIIFDRVGGAILRHYYFSQTSGLYYRTNYSIDSTKADILVFGSSRANHHYVPEVFEDSLNMSFYNTGRDGNFILYNYAIFKLILKRYSPKIIIIDINPDEIYYDHNSYDRLSSLLPYYQDHPEIRGIVELRGPFEKVKTFSAIYPFNSNMLTIIVGNLEFNKRRKGDRKGYVPLFNKMKEVTMVPIEMNNLPIDTVKLNAIKDIGEICENKKIMLFYLQSPSYTEKKNTYAKEILMKIANDFNAKFFDYSEDTIFKNNPSLFQDIEHLNNDGATIFSGIVSKRIKIQALTENKISSNIFNKELQFGH